MSSFFGIKICSDPEEKNRQKFFLTEKLLIAGQSGNDSVPNLTKKKSAPAETEALVFLGA